MLARRTLNIKDVNPGTASSELTWLVLSSPVREMITEKLLNLALVEA